MLYYPHYLFKGRLRLENYQPDNVALVCDLVDMIELYHPGGEYCMQQDDAMSKYYCGLYCQWPPFTMISKKLDVFFCQGTVKGMYWPQTGINHNFTATPAVFENFIKKVR